MALSDVKGRKDIDKTTQIDVTLIKDNGIQRVILTMKTMI